MGNPIKKAILAVIEKHSVTYEDHHAMELKILKEDDFDDVVDDITAMIEKTALGVAEIKKSLKDLDENPDRVRMESDYNVGQKEGFELALTYLGFDE